MKKLILASASPRRKQLLKILDIQFEVFPSGIEENVDPSLVPTEQVEELSRQKAQTVSKKFPDALIIAADTMVVYNNEVIGKPKNEKEAIRILSKLSGTNHSIITGFTVYDATSKKTVTNSTETKITFRKIAPEEIAAFVKKEQPFDKAGGYAIHELAAIFIEKIEGDCNGATGLSLFQLAKALKEFGIDVL